MAKYITEYKGIKIMDKIGRHKINILDNKYSAAISNLQKDIGSRYNDVERRLLDLENTPNAKGVKF